MLPPATPRLLLVQVLHFEHQHQLNLMLQATEQACRQQLQSKIAIPQQPLECCPGRVC